MRNKILNVILTFTLLGYFSASSASEDHKGEPSEETHEEKGHDESGHDENEKGGHGDEEESSSVGPEKGITEKSEAGFKLSTEAIKTMEIKMENFSGPTITVEKQAVVLVRDEKSIYRVRDGWIKRVEIQIIKRTGNQLTISSSLLKAGDQLVVHGTGFLRTAEVVLTEGASHGH